MSLAVMICPAGAFASAQQQDHLRFAFLADTHIAAEGSSVADLSACVRDINAYDSLDFVIFGGDVTNFGSDDEIRLAKSMTDSICRPVYFTILYNRILYSVKGAFFIMCFIYKNHFFLPITFILHFLTFSYDYS